MPKPQRDKKILLRVTDSEKIWITTEAKTRGMSVNDYLCACALEFPLQDGMNLRQEVQRLALRVSALEGKKVRLPNA